MWLFSGGGLDKTLGGELDVGRIGRAERLDVMGKGILDMCCMMAMEIYNDN